ncbi:Acetyl-coenzyme A carboxylase carboxyl transferase subunit alpha [Alteracholeplasma palmae J233]|uniref:Acetyl-coenzyme A carboxylase carboxyl transferase subunit alpha n=1 Tax=Alteracholeplasma palmae (strain ATCC 49389 / J233) TaxID=1318466 RepID=U4KLG8_ALTPJ|nr:acetyl-CoA carboxylase carboxyltransferase subunit alpha [Alteracholeplasma palmae]CCV64673.1 Acetyl-coenzyme A carboxylase carboxyl transferase subunit alpha [Alteracholeplasma palmae J233]
MNNHTAWEKVLLARDSKRITSKTLIERVFTDFIELHGDRYIGDDQSIIGGLAFFGNTPVTIIAQEKGVTTKEKIMRNFGMPHPEGYHKALRLMKQAEKFGRPIITIIDTPGAYPGIKAEERGQAHAIANNLKEMITLKTPIISVVLGEAGSGGALAIGVSDSLAMFENSIYSILSPEGFAAILFKDSQRAKEAAELMKLTALDLKEMKIVDEIIKEKVPLSVNPDEGIEAFKKYLTKTLKELVKKNTEELLTNRYNKFRNIGVFTNSQEPKEDI